jgi:hypothetical protein
MRMRVPMVIMHPIVRMHVHYSIVTTEARSCLPHRCAAVK